MNVQACCGPQRIFAARVLCAASLSCVMALASASVVAAGYPERPVRLVVPFAPGGSTDILARLLGEQLGRKLGQPFIVENKPGGGTAIGAQWVAHAQPDGYTIMLSTSSTFTINPAMSQGVKLQYDPVADFEPVAQVSDLALVLVGNVSRPFQSLEDILQAAKQAPGKYDYASFGTGTGAHLAGEMFKQATGVSMTHVPYTGGPAALTAVLSNQVPFTFTSVTVALPHVKDGKLKAYGVMSETRAALMPQVPTFIEQGYPGATLVGWNAVVVPKGTPASVIDTLEAALGEIMKDEAVVRQVVEAGLEPSYSRIANWADLVNKETARFRVVVEKAGIAKDK